MRLRPTKEVLVAGIALVAALLTVRSRLATPVTPGPLPKPPPIEAPADVVRDDIPVARARLLSEARATEGRDPFAASDIWEDPAPVALPLPPEVPDERIVPVLSLRGGKVRAPHPPRIAALPKPVKEESTPSSNTGAAAPAEPRGAMGKGDKP